MQRMNKEELEKNGEVIKRLISGDSIEKKKTEKLVNTYDLTNDPDFDRIQSNFEYFEDRAIENGFNLEYKRDYYYCFIKNRENEDKQSNAFLILKSKLYMYFFSMSYYASRNNVADFINVDVSVGIDLNDYLDFLINNEPIMRFFSKGVLEKVKNEKESKDVIEKDIAKLAKKGYFSIGLNSLKLTNRGAELYCDIFNEFKNKYEYIE